MTNNQAALLAAALIATRTGDVDTDLLTGKAGMLAMWLDQQDRASREAPPTEPFTWEGS